MKTYRVGPTPLVFAGRIAAPGASFTYDFSLEGPEGEHGPAREAALLAAGALIEDSAVPRVRATPDTKE